MAALVPWWCVKRCKCAAFPPPRDLKFDYMLEHPSIRHYSPDEGSDNVIGAGNQQERPSHDKAATESSEAIRRTSARAEAKAQNEKKYHGSPCSVCGGTERYTSGGSCVRSYSHGPARTEYQKANSRKRRQQQRVEGYEFVYECYGKDGELLYIGRTNHAYQRIACHKNRSAWWGEVARMSWTQFTNHEQRRIMRLKPKYNRQLTGSG